MNITIELFQKKKKKGSGFEAQEFVIKLLMCLIASEDIMMKPSILYRDVNDKLQQV